MVKIRGRRDRRKLWGTKTPSQTDEGTLECAKQDDLVFHLRHTLADPIVATIALGNAVLLGELSLSRQGQI